MELAHLLSPIIFVVLSLTVGAVFKTLLKKVNIPYTVALFCFGLVIGLVNREGWLAESPALHDALTGVGNMDPNLILYIFLPVLVFDASYELNVHIFKKNLVNASLLAIPGVALAMLLTATLMMALVFIAPGYIEWNWTHAMMFGALISATDPVAVVALLKELGVSKRFSTLVDAESLLNDGTGIVLFMVFFTTFTVAGGGGETSPYINFLIVVFGGMLLGYLSARVVVWFLDWAKSENVVQNSVIIFAAYATFILVQGYLDLSGVIALVAFGLTITYYGKPLFKANVNQFMESFWELATYIANTLIFIIVGVLIAMNVDISVANVLLLLAVYVGVNVIRLMVIFVLFPIMKRCGYGLSVREAIILGWGGLRGAVGLILALMVSCTLDIAEPVREQVLFFTAGIVTLTLTINASTSRMLLNQLGLIRGSKARALLDYSYQLRLKEESDSYLEKLESREALQGTDWEMVDAFRPQKGKKPMFNLDDNDLLANLRLKVLDRNKQLTHQLYNEGAISETTYKRIMLSFDMLYDYDGHCPLSERRTVFAVFERPALVVWLRKHAFLRETINRWSHRWVVEAYDLGRGFLIIQKAALQTLSEFKGSSVFSDVEKEKMKVLEDEVQDNISRISKLLSFLSQEYPRSFRCALTQKAVRMLLCHERRCLTQWLEDGMISEKDVQAYQDNLDVRFAKLNQNDTLRTMRQREWKRSK